MWVAFFIYQRNLPVTGTAIETWNWNLDKSLKFFLEDLNWKPTRVRTQENSVFSSSALWVAFLFYLAKQMTLSVFHQEFYRHECTDQTNTSGENQRKSGNHEVSKDYWVHNKQMQIKPKK